VEVGRRAQWCWEGVGGPHGQVVILD
jgi:hypothetical protein